MHRIIAAYARKSLPLRGSWPNFRWMSDILDLRIFARATATGSLSTAGRELGLSAAVVSKRLSRLEERLGVRLLNRTTRRVAPTDEGQAYYDEIVSALALIDEAESALSGRATHATGVLRVSVPTSFGRMHVVPRLRGLIDAHPQLRLSIDLSDDFVDIVGGRVDVAVRIMAPEDSGLIARKLAPNRRVLCAAPDYLERYGQPQTIEELGNHRLLAASNQIRWRLQGPEGTLNYRPISAIETNSSEVVREMVVSGLGIGLRSTWDVAGELRSGALVRILPDHEGISDVGIYAVYASRRFVPLKIRVLIDFLLGLFGPHPYWDRDLPA